MQDALDAWKHLERSRRRRRLRGALDQPLAILQGSQMVLEAARLRLGELQILRDQPRDALRLSLALSWPQHPC